MRATLPETEPERLQALMRCGVLDTAPESDFDDVARLAAAICGTPIALVSLIDADRQWFKAVVGLGVRQTHRDASFCAHAILGQGILVVPDARRDVRFSDNPLVTGEPGIRFYAGEPLVDPDGHALGTLCVIDRVPHELEPGQAEALRALGRQVSAQLELRCRLAELERVAAERARAEEGLRATEARFQAFMDHSPALAFMKGEDGRYAYVNAPFQRLFRVGPEGLHGKTDGDWLPPETAAQLRANDLAVLRSGEAAQLEEVITTPDGRHRDWLVIKFPFVDGGGRRMLGGVGVDISERRELERRLADQLGLAVVLNDELEAQRVALAEANARLEELATTDGLTGVRNRRAFQSALATSFSLASRHGLPLSLVLLDVDRFKAYNDAFGHPAGDDVLRAVGTTLAAGVREHDVVARYGGEEFALVLPATDAEGARLLAERMRAAVAGHDWDRRPVTISLGVATTSPATESAEALLAEADGALYESKRLGRDRVTAFGGLGAGRVRSCPGSV